MWPKSAGSGRNHISFVKIDSLDVLDVFCTKNRYFIVDNDEITCLWKPSTKMLIEKIHVFNEKTVQIEQSQYALKFWYGYKNLCKYVLLSSKNTFPEKNHDSGRFEFGVDFNRGSKRSREWTYFWKLIKITKNIDFSKFDKSAGIMIFVRKCVLWAQKNIFAPIVDPIFNLEFL